MKRLKKGFGVVLFFSVVFIACTGAVKPPDEAEREQDKLKAPRTASMYVTFDPNGGAWPDSPDIVSLSAKSDQFPNFPTTDPVFGDYIFLGWDMEKHTPYSNSANAPSYDERFNSSIKIIAPITVYAIWIEKPPNSHTVVFVSSLEGEPETIRDVQYAFEYNGYTLTGSLPTPGTKRHYASNGRWYIGLTGYEEFTRSRVITEQELKVYSRWYPNTYIVSFYGGPNTPALHYRTFPYLGEEIHFPADQFPPQPASPATDQLEGSYTFLGWFLNQSIVLNPQGVVPASESLLSSGYLIENDLMVYAGWRRSNNVVAFQVYNENIITPVYRAAVQQSGSGIYKVTGTIPHVGNRPHYISDEQWYFDENAGMPFSQDAIPANFLANSTKVHGNWLSEWMGKKIEFHHWSGGPKVTTRLAQLNQSTGEGYALMGDIPDVPKRSGYTTDEKWYYWSYSGSQPHLNEFTTSTTIDNNMTVFARWTQNGNPIPDSPPPPPPPSSQVVSYEVDFYLNYTSVAPHKILSVPSNSQLNYLPSKSERPDTITDASGQRLDLLGWALIEPSDFIKYDNNRDGYLTANSSQWSNQADLHQITEFTYIRNKEKIYAIWQIPGRADVHQ